MGIDAGTSRVRAILFELDGTLVAEGSEQPPLNHPRPGWASIEAEDLWVACLKAIRSVVSQVEKPERIRSVAVASVGEAAVPIDSGGNAVYSMIAWYDCRTEPQARWLNKHIGKERLFKTTGLNLYPIFGLCKQLWIRQNAPEAFSRTVSWLNTADFLAWKLCGVPATDYSLASRTFALNIRNLKYAEDLLKDAGIPLEWYQPLVPSGTRLGNLLPEVAEATGLKTDCSVASGGHDHFVGALITGAVNQGNFINSMGTAEAVTIFMEQPIDDMEVGKQGYAQGVIVLDRPYYYLVGGLFTSGGSVQWYHQLNQERFSHKQLIDEAMKIPPGSNGVLFMPHLRVGSPPNPAELSRGAFIGLGTDSNHAVLYRSMLEGMACDVRMIFEGFNKFPQVPEVKAIQCFGGESKNKLLMEIKASVMNLKLARLDIAEAVSLGAAVLGGIGAGIFRNLDEALSTLRYGSETVIPRNDWSRIYKTHYEKVYSGAWPQVRPLQERLFEVYPPAATNP